MPGGSRNEAQKLASHGQAGLAHLFCLRALTGRGTLILGPPPPPSGGVMDKLRSICPPPAASPEACVFCCWLFGCFWLQILQILHSSRRERDVV